MGSSGCRTLGMADKDKQRFFMTDPTSPYCHTLRMMRQVCWQTRQLPVIFIRFKKLENVKLCIY